MYSQKVLKCFKKPHNVGKIKNPDGIGKVGNVICGDVMWLYIKVKNNIITNIKFETFGCVSAIATSSMITDLAKGKTLQEAQKITKTDVVDNLDGLPPVKLHCSVLAVDALAQAIYDYYKKNNLPISKNLESQHQRIVKDTTTVEHRYHH